MLFKPGTGNAQQKRYSGTEVESIVIGIFIQNDRWQRGKAVWASFITFQEAIFELSRKQLSWTLSIDFIEGLLTSRI